MRAFQQPRRFSNFNQPLSEVLECLVQKGLLRPLINVESLSSNSPGYDPNKYCNFHQAIGHPTDSCKRLKHEIQNLIDSGKILDPEKSNPNPNTKTNPFLSYPNVPPTTTMTINSAAREEEMEKSLEAPCRVEGLLGQPSGKFDYKVFYSKPPSYDIPLEKIVPTGWGDEFEDEDNEGYNVWIDNTE